MILSCKNIDKAFGTDQILTQVSFHINEHEKAAIVGNNGTGKSTLLKIIIGELSADQGEVILAKDTSIGYLAQHQELSNEHTIYEEMLEVKQEILEKERQLRILEQQMKETLDDEKELQRILASYHRLTHEFEMENGYAVQSEITGVLKGLGFSEAEFHQKTSALSGGQKTRVALGKLLLSSPNIILLDEPINHLDMHSIEWLETYLLNYKGAVIIVAHDRYFLDKVVTKVIELEAGGCRMYQGNYTAYAQKKAMLRDAMLKRYYNQQQEIKHHEQVIAKLRSFNREKSIRRAESREKMLDKLERADKPITPQTEMQLRLEPSVTSGNDVLAIRSLSKAYGGKVLFADLNFEIKREEKVAIIGDNGTGKTTLLKIINGLVPCDCGEILLGSKVRVGYYDQEHQVLNMEKTLFDELQDTYPSMDNTRIRNILAAFLFTGDDVFKRIRDLSGGERGRVSLAKLMLSESNLLILDEPTNHLDITSKEILEEAIRNYTGTVLYVSHDRYFINTTATRILDLTGQRLLNYIGNYDYYMEKKEDVERTAFHSPKPPEENPRTLAGKLYGTAEDRKDWSAPAGSPMPSKTAASFDPSSKKETSKLTWQQQKEENARKRRLENAIKKCEDQIHGLETRNAEIDELLTKEEIYTDVPRLMELNNEKKELEEQLETLMEQWEALLEEAEEA